MRDYDDDDYYREDGYADRGYDNGDGYRRSRRDSSGFDDEEFGGARYQRRGDRNRDWSDDFDERDGGRTRRPASRQRRTTPEYDDDDDYPMQPKQSFRKRHPVLMNFFYICIAAAVGGWLLMLFLDYWTFHGQERTVPDVKGQVYAAAAGNVGLSGLRPVLTDSVFDAHARPGTVVEQIPIPGARIKKGGSVYLTVVAFSPKLVAVPDFMNVSVRQARSMFEGLGIREVREVPVISEYSGLVLGAKFNGASLHPGARIPVSAIVTLEVGTGYADDSYDDEDEFEEIDITEETTEE